MKTVTITIRVDDDTPSQECQRVRQALARLDCIFDKEDDVRFYSGATNRDTSFARFKIEPSEGKITQLPPNATKDTWPVCTAKIDKNRTKTGLDVKMEFLPCQKAAQDKLSKDSGLLGPGVL